MGGFGIEAERCRNEARSDCKAKIMKERRKFLKTFVAFFAGVGVWLNPVVCILASGVKKVGKIILPKGTDRETLVGKNPATLDTRNLEPTPLKEFGTMGLTDHAVDLETWRLEVTGEVGEPLRLRYEEITALPAIERNVLLICPGFFANHGMWKGISIQALLDLAKADKGVTHVTIRGPEGRYESLQRYPIEDVLSDKVFLAYQVNGKPLPQRHGFPLRTVAEDYYGYDWVKYVYKITVEKIG
jgi:DMSO/TMAO reductase YedYZ molybdopterin-dependent catalytic subunit